MASPGEDVQAEEGHTAGGAGGRGSAGGATRPWELTDEAAWLHRTGIQPCLAASLAFSLIGDFHNSSSRLFEKIFYRQHCAAFFGEPWRQWILPGTNIDFMQMAALLNHAEALNGLDSRGYCRDRSYLGKVFYGHVSLFPQHNAYLDAVTQI